MGQMHQNRQGALIQRGFCLWAAGQNAREGILTQILHHHIAMHGVLVKNQGGREGVAFEHIRHLHIGANVLQRRRGIHQNQRTILCDQPMKGPVGCIRRQGDDGFNAQGQGAEIVGHRQAMYHGVVPPKCLSISFVHSESTITVKNRCTGCPKTRERVCRAPSPMAFSVCPLCPSKIRR